MKEFVKMKLVNKNIANKDELNKWKMEEMMRKHEDKLEGVDLKKKTLKKNAQMFAKEVIGKHDYGDDKVVSSMKTKIEDLSMKKEMSILRKNE